MSYEKLPAISRGFSRRFPDGNDPFKIMTRLLEECGELAQQVNHFEGQGIKQQKYGLIDPACLVKEVRQVVQSALQVAQYYGLEPDLQAELDEIYARLLQEGWITASEDIP